MSQLPENMEQFERSGVLLRSVETIRSTEAIDVESCLALRDNIVDSGRWTHPIVVDKGSGLIMDGNHRYQVAKILGFRLIPCVEMNYFDEGVEVRHWNSGAPFPIQRILELVDSREVFPYKSTRHSFPVDIPETAIPIARLR